uniref:Smg4_UPF3 domain-containing protein n=1 Tax=Globodera pallida TaxID=36090 RepID=A0A183CKF6_GLOPA
MTVGSGEEEQKIAKRHRDKDKEELTKIVLRRLPPGIGPDDLRALFDPLSPDEPHAFWFCAAADDANDGDDATATLRRARCEFARAYLAFREEKNALSFAERFNGYVFVDKNDVSFLKFLKRREEEAEDGGGPRRVTDFDELVRQLEEKRRRLDEGQVQETPLTEFIRRAALEKARKPARRAALNTAEMPADSRAKKEHKNTAGGDCDKKAADDRCKTAVPKSSGRIKTRKPRRRATEEQKAKNDKKIADDGGKPSEVKSAAVQIKTRKSRRRGSALGTAGGKEDIDIGTAKEQIAKKSAAGGGGDKKLLVATKDESVLIKYSRRNRDRPEREIYRPGQRKTTAAAVSSATTTRKQPRKTDEEADESKNIGT